VTTHARGATGTVSRDGTRGGQKDAKDKRTGGRSASGKEMVKSAKEKRGEVTNSGWATLCDPALAKPDKTRGNGGGDKSEKKGEWGRTEEKHRENRPGGHKNGETEEPPRDLSKESGRGEFRCFQLRRIGTQVAENREERTILGHKQGKKGRW